MLESQEKGRTSQFIFGCDTDWNLNHEFILWLNHWFKEFKKKAEIDLEFYKFDYNGETLTQLQIIDEVIELTDKIHTYYYEFGKEEYEQLANDVDEVFDLFKLVYWCMWW